MNVVDVVVLAAYGSLLVELVVFPIPSEASTLQLLMASDDDRTAAADRLQHARRRSLSVKVLRFFLPTAAGVVLWLLPLLCVFVPSVGETIGRADVPLLVVPGILLVALGRAVTFTSVLQLRAQRRRAGAPGWLFRRSRNPGLVGMFTCYFGLCCLCPSPLLWFGMPLYFANMHGRVRLEEAHQEARLGERWREYAARVPRYVGRVPALRHGGSHD